MPGRAYPENSRSNDLWFQHLAIVVSDMDAAYAHLCAHAAWHPISRGGPQTLPESDGGVRAFKFRDPDGHPLELLWLPPARARGAWQERSAGLRKLPFLGIDHTALAVKSMRRSLDFYGALGMRLRDRSLNHGTAQSHLDGLPAARVRVSALRAASAAAPGIELLAYEPPGRPAPHPCVINLSTDWITLAGTAKDHFAPRAIADPDGHLLLLVDQGFGTNGSPA
jgi:catechol 2,3-dioxygenase-like lactoylglutathione lyase family enzyme